MTRGKLTETATLDAGSHARWTELCGPEGADDEESADDHPGYGSLLGLGAHKLAKKPVIALDLEIAEQAAQVMEINAGQLVAHPDRSAHGFAALGLDQVVGGGEAEPFDEGSEPSEAYDEVDEELDAAVAEWAARVFGSGDDDLEEAGEAAWPGERKPEEEQEPPVLADVYEPPVEAAEAWNGEPAIEEAAIDEFAAQSVVGEPVHEEPVHEDAVVERAWLEWARALVEPPAPAGEIAPADDTGDEPAGPPEPEFLVHTVDDVQPDEPELPKHELRQMLAQISRPRPSRHLWRRLLALLKRLFA